MLSISCAQACYPCAFFIFEVHGYKYIFYLCSAAELRYAHVTRITKFCELKSFLFIWVHTQGGLSDEMVNITDLKSVP